MQLNQSRLVDLFAQERRHSALTDFLSNMRALHSSFCAKIYFAAASLSTAWIRLGNRSARAGESQPIGQQHHFQPGKSEWTGAGNG